MKIRVTLMTENDKTIEGKTKEEIERISAKAWQLLFDALLMESDDKVLVESCELVEN
jgi:hypothetical protein